MSVPEIEISKTAIYVWPVITAAVSYGFGWYKSVRVAESKIKSELNKSKLEKLWDIKRSRYESLIDVFDRYYVAINDFNYRVQLRDEYEDEEYIEFMDMIEGLYSSIAKKYTIDQIYYSSESINILNEYMDYIEQDHRKILSMRYKGGAIELGEDIYKRAQPKLKKAYQSLIKEVKRDIEHGID